MSLRNPFRLYNNFLCCLWALFRWFTVKLQSRIWWGVWPARSRLFWWTWVPSCPQHLALSIKDAFRCYVVKGAGGSNFCKCQIQPRRTSMRNRHFLRHPICWTMFADSWEKPALCLRRCRRLRQLFCVVLTGASVRKHHHSKRRHSYCVISASRDLCWTIWFTSIFHLRNRTVLRDGSLSLSTSAPTGLSLSGRFSVKPRLNNQKNTFRPTLVTIKLRHNAGLMVVFCSRFSYILPLTQSHILYWRRAPTPAKSTQESSGLTFYLIIA